MCRQGQGHHEALISTSNHEQERRARPGAFICAACERRSILVTLKRSLFTGPIKSYDNRQMKAMKYVEAEATHNQFIAVHPGDCWAK